MADQDLQFRAAYGEAMFFAHLIEDLIALHLYECSFFHVNQYPGRTPRKIREMSHKERIDELLTIYGEQDKRDGSVTRLVTALHHLRKIRNHLTHALIPQVGCDFTAPEGRDQIVAMLKNVSYWERGWLTTLQQAHESVLKGGILHCLDAALEREDPPFDGRVSKSKIQEHLDALQGQMK